MTWRLVVSALGDDTGGGIFVLEGSELTMIDSACTTGIAVSADRRHFARLYWSEKHTEEPGELRVYDETGVCAHHCIDDLRQPHSALWSRDSIVAVSTGTNAILWVGPSRAR